MLDVPLRTIRAAGPGRAATPRRVATPTPGMAAGAVMAAAPLAVILFPLLRAGGDAGSALKPAAVLAAAAATTALGVALAAAILVPSLLSGSRQAVMPAMVVGAATGVAAVLVVPATAGMLTDRFRVAMPDALVEYGVAAAAALGLALVLAVHRLARVGGDGVALIGVAALVVGAVEALMPAEPTLDDGIVGLMAAAAVLLVGLGSATVAGGPTRRWTGASELDVAAPAEPVTVTRDAAPARDAVADRTLTGLVTVSVAIGVLARLLLGSSSGPAADDALAQLTGGSFHDAIAGAAGTAHPPLSVALAWCSQHLFGPVFGGSAAFRWPAYLAGVLLVPAAFATGRALYGNRTAMVAAAVAAVGPAFVWASAAAGPTTITALLLCLALLALTMALRSTGRTTGWWILFGLSSAALVWTHQFGVWTVAVLHGAAGFAVIRSYRTAAGDARADRDAGLTGTPHPARPGLAMAGWVGAFALTALAVGALFGSQHGFGAASTPPTLEYATNAAPAGGHTPFGLAAGALTTIVGFHPPDVTSRLLALWPLGILGAFALFGRRWSTKGVLLVGLAAAPFLALLVADLAGAPRQPPLALEWLAPALPAVALAIGRAVDRLTAAQGRMGLVLAAVITVLALGTADQSVRVAGRRPPAAGPSAAGPSADGPAPSPTTTPRR